MASPPIPTPQVSDATYPFNKSSADIIIRSSDLVDFRVYSQILVAASPIFEGMFEVPQPPPEEQNTKYGLPIVALSEDGRTLDALLRLCYPINKPETRLPLEEIESSLRAAMKYEMELAITLLSADLTRFVSSEPLHVWAVACRLRLESLASLAAEELRRWKCWGPLARADPDALLSAPSNAILLEGVTAGQLCRLYRYINAIRLTATRVPPSRYQLIEPASTTETTGSAEEVAPSQSHFRESLDMTTADMTCLSSDGVTFHAHQVVLGAASSLLRDKIAAIAAKSTAKSVIQTQRPLEPEEVFVPSEPSLPVLHFEETSLVLPHLLSCCYPGLVPVHITDLALLSAVISAAEHHKITATRVILLDHWSKVARTDALRAYFLAIQAGDSACAKEAARHVLSAPIEGMYVREMEASPALAYQRLLSYYTSCRDVAKRGILGESPPEPPQAKRGKRGSAKKSSGAVAPPVASEEDSEPWLQTYMKNTWKNLERGPDPDFLPTSEHLLIASTEGDKQPWCDACRDVAAGLVRTSNDFRALRDAMQKVELELEL